MIKRYKIIKPIILSFTTPQDQYESIIHPKESAYLECDGSTIWYCYNDEKRETITMANAIQSWLCDGKVEGE